MPFVGWLLVKAFFLFLIYKNPEISNYNTCWLNIILKHISWTHFVNRMKVLKLETKLVKPQHKILSTYLFFHKPNNYLRPKRNTRRTFFQLVFFTSHMWCKDIYHYSVGSTKYFIQIHWNSIRQNKSEYWKTLGMKIIFWWMEWNGKVFSSTFFGPFKCEICSLSFVIG